MSKLSNTLVATWLATQSMACWSESLGFGQWQGFVAQGYVGQADNDFFDHDGDGSFEMFEAGLNGTWQFRNNLRVSGQTIYRNMGDNQEEGLRLDYALVDYQFYSSDGIETGLRLGRIKNTHNLYGGSLDMPFTRPTVFMPQSIYPDLIRDSYIALDGISFYSKLFTHNGELIITLNYGEAILTEESTESILGKFAEGDIESDGLFYGSINYRFDGSWLFGFSVLQMNVEFDADSDSAISQAEGSLDYYTGTLQYQAEFWELSIEYQVTEYDVGGLMPVPFLGIPAIANTWPGIKQDGEGYYAQLRYFTTPTLTFLLRYTAFFPNTDDRSGKDLAAQTDQVAFLLNSFGFNTLGLVGTAHKGYSKDWSTGITWTPAPQWQFMIEYHYIEGTAWTPPLFSAGLTNTEKYWSLWTAQLAYRF